MGALVFNFLAIGIVSYHRAMFVFVFVFVFVDVW